MKNKLNKFLLDDLSNLKNIYMCVYMHICKHNFSILCSSLKHIFKFFTTEKEFLSLKKNLSNGIIPNIKLTR